MHGLWCDDSRASFRSRRVSSLGALPYPKPFLCAVGRRPRRPEPLHTIVCGWIRPTNVHTHSARDVSNWREKIHVRMTTLWLVCRHTHTHINTTHLPRGPAFAFVRISYLSATSGHIRQGPGQPVPRHCEFPLKNTFGEMIMCAVILATKTNDTIRFNVPDNGQSNAKPFMLLV